MCEMLETLIGIVLGLCWIVLHTWHGS